MVTTNFLLQELRYSYEFLHVIYSIILLVGLYQIGYLMFKIKILRNVFIEISELKYLNVFISTNLILLIFYPLIILFNYINFIPLISITIFIFGIFRIILKLKKKFYFRKITYNKNSLDKYLVIITLILLFLLSLSPNTHGDSLGYHFTVAKKLLATGKYHHDITHFHSLLSGSGEILIAIGLFFGSEQFGNLVQFSGLISIFGIIKKIKNKYNYYYFLLIITSPVILFLSSTAKPQLFHICSSSVIFSLYFMTNSKSLNIVEKNWKIIISILVLIVSVSAKFNFLISSALIGFIILYNSFKDKNFLYFVGSFILCFFIFYFPIIFFKSNYFNVNIFQYFYSPLPLNIIGFEEFQQYLTRYGRENNLIEILFATNISKFTNSIGIAFLYLLIINFQNIKALVASVIICLLIIFHYNYGQHMGRSFLEPLFWTLLICARYGTLYRIKLFDFFCRAQALVVILGIIYGIYSLFPGSLTVSLKDKMLSQNANGYSLFKWANTKLNKNDVVFSMHRSISLGKSKFIAMDFIPFVDFTDDRSNIFVEAIYKKKPNYLLTYGYSKNKPMLNEFKNCVGELMYFQKDVGKFEARNPFIRGRKYDGYIFKITKTDIPSCIIN
jgi:hypothetical protein